MKTAFLGVLALACALASPALAQPIVAAPAGTIVPAQGICFGPLNGTATCVDASHPLPVSGSTGGTPYTTATPLTPGTPVTAGRALFLACTAAGTVRIKLSSGNTLDVPVYVGPNELTNYAVSDIVAANTTATCVATVLN